MTILNKRVEVLEYNIETVPLDNSQQFELYQDIVHQNNLNTDKMIEDLRNVHKQHFEMENINESLEQRIEQLKGQRDLSLLLVKTGQEHELKSHHEDADNQKAKLTKLLSGT